MVKTRFFTVLLASFFVLPSCFSDQPPAASLSFRSFDGGGPEYTATVHEPKIVSVRSSRKYDKADHERLTGAGYAVIFTLTGLKPGKTTMRVSSRSPIVPAEDLDYAVTVDESLKVTLTKTGSQTRLP